jgi:translation initiation factor 1
VSAPRGDNRAMGSMLSTRRGGSGGLVYSTDAGTMCPACRQPVAQCTCRAVPVAPGDGVVRVSRETKGRAGKGVTLVRGLALEAAALSALARELKAFCGTGGTVKDGVIEIQGDHRDRLVEHLRAQGRSVKAAGG